MIDLNDSEILIIEKTVKWAQEQQGQHRNLEDFRRAVVDKFNQDGFQVNVLCFETNQPGCYAFDLEITGRVPGSRQFDPDRQVHEVVNNLLELPDQDKGYIKTDRGMFEDLAAGNVSGQKHKH